MKKLFFNFQNSIKAGIIALFASYISFPYFFELTQSPIPSNNYSFYSLDASWVLTLGFVNLKNLVWGSDFAFTYGPLSYLAIRNGWGMSKYSFLLFDIFYFINIFAICFITYKKSINKFLVILAIAAAFYTIPGYIGGSQALVLLLFMVFWIRQNLEDIKWFKYVFSIMLLVLMFFIKFNTALIAFLPYFGMLIYFAITRREKYSFLILYSIIPITLIYFFSKLLNVELYGYVISGIEMVSGYNEIMYLNQFDIFKYQSLIYVFIFLSLLFLVIRIFLDRKMWLKNVFIVCLYCLCLYIIYKQAFVRADSSHVIDFFCYILLLLLCFIDFFIFKIKNFRSLITLTLLVIPVIIIAKNPQYKSFQNSNKIIKTAYFKGFSNFTSTSGLQLFPNENQLPETIKNKIENKTVDAYPWNIQLLFENELNYLPRPVIQSYTAYTKYLENLNFEHYNSKNAPEFVIYEYLSIDNRYPLFDESKMNLILLNNYIAVDSFSMHESNYLLLQKKKDFRPIELEFKREYAILADSPLIPEMDIYYEVELYHSLSGKIYGIFNHAPDIILSIKTKNLKQFEYKTSNALLKSGLFSNTFIFDNDSFQQSISNTIIKENEIRQYKFLPKKNKYFKEKIRIKEYKIKRL